MRLATYTLPGYPINMNESSRRAATVRLKKIEGQVRGIVRMVEDDRYCIDVLTQISAIRAALHKVEEEVLKDHVAHCVAHAFKEGDLVEQQNKVNELVAVLARLAR
jgi:DNA-binding FrmR family transcriptional regulator